MLDETKRTRLRPRVSGFTLLELQIAIVLLAFGVVTLASLLATQSRQLKRLQGAVRPGATVYVTESSDPWVQKLTAAAKATSTPLSQLAAPAVAATNTVEIVQQERDLAAERITVSADVTPIN
jgi:hypothetical protein